MWPQYTYTREQLAIPRNTRPPVFAPWYQPMASPPPCQSDHDEPEWVRCDLPRHPDYLETP